MKTLQLVERALAPTETALYTEFKVQMVRHYEGMLEKLRASDMDAEKAFPFPCSLMSRERYMCAKQAYDYCRSMTTSANKLPWRSRNDPDIRQEKLSALSEIDDTARLQAKASLAAYTNKLAKKIHETGLLAEEIEYRGGLDPWGWSHVVVNPNSPFQQVWKTKMIVNISCLGKLFNQWPTTLVK